MHRAALGARSLRRAGPRVRARLAPPALGRALLHGSCPKRAPGEAQGDAETPSGQANNKGSIFDKFSKFARTVTRDPALDMILDKEAAQAADQEPAAASSADQCGSPNVPEDDDDEYVDMFNPDTGEWNGPRQGEPTRYGDWAQKGRCSDFK